MPLKVIFACVHNAGRSQMAAALFNQLVPPTVARAISAGTSPAERVHPEVVIAMQELGVDLSKMKPQKLTEQISKEAGLLVTMGCGEQCPYIPGAVIEDWPLPDPKGKPLDEVRKIRDDVAARVHDLMKRRGWSS